MRAADRKRKRRAISKQQKLMREKRRSEFPCPTCGNRILFDGCDCRYVYYTCGYKRGTLGHFPTMCQNWIPVEEMNSEQLRKHIKRLMKESVANERST